MLLSDFYLHFLGTTGYAYVSNLAQPKRYLAHIATFSRMATVKEVYDFLSQRLRIRPEDMRLWHFKDEVRYMLMYTSFVPILKSVQSHIICKYMN